MSSMKAIYIYLFLMHLKYVHIHKIQCLHKANLHTFKRWQRFNVFYWFEVCASLSISHLFHIISTIENSEVFSHP